MINKSTILFYKKVFAFSRRYPFSERIKFVQDYLSLYKRKGLALDEYYNFEFDKRSQVFRDSFLGIEERRLYLDLLNPILYHNCSRNKYITHKMFEGTGIKSSKLYCYYQPEGLVDNEDGSIIADSLGGVVQILLRQGVKSCVIKLTDGSHGDGVEVVKNIEYQNDDAIVTKHDGKTIMLSDILSDKPLIFESVVQQSKQFAELNESSVNTVRFMTTLWPDGSAKVFATFIKIGRAGKCVDNAGAGGNVDVCVDVESGEIKYAIQYDGWHNIKDIDVHPDTGNRLNGVVINDWEDIKKQVIRYQQAFPYCKAAGWDIAITDNGPVVIEVNDCWDTTGQFFCRKGWRNDVRECYLAWKKTGEKHPNRVGCRLTQKQIHKIAQI